MFQQFVDILPWLGDAFSYVLAIGEMPMIGVYALMTGRSYTWIVTNIFTGLQYDVVIPSYNALLDFLIGSDIRFIEKIGETISGVLSTIGGFCYELIFPRGSYFEIAWDFVPLYVGLPVMLIRVSLFTFAIRMVLKVIGGVIEVAS